ncbi:MAG: hypothetical protein LAO19_18390 [Acidobacteriia bacterium]|nr:hypothetical protein [Terriglobia bacterium]
MGLWGDLPYSEVQADPGVPNLIMDMNSQNLAFSVHDGDLKAGKGFAGDLLTTCDNAKYVQAIAYFNALKSPAAFTPGDNDWTDCDVASNGNFNSLERLDHERQVIFNTPFTLGQHHLRQAMQGVTTDSKPTPCKGFVAGDVNGTTTYKDVACVENRRWTYRGVTYATLNIQGSCNNRCKDHPDETEFAARNAADIAWMQETFEVAKERDSAAVMFISQADPGFFDHPVESENTRDPKTLVVLAGSTPDGFHDFLVALRDAVKAFGKPVAYVHGDTHYFRIDKPFYDADPPNSVSTTARRLENFIRVETFGDNVFSVDATHPDQNDLNNVHWVKVLVDPDSREVFAFQPQIVPGNRVVVPAP